MAIIMSATHPNVAPILDGYHYWFGLSKLEDIDLIPARGNRLCAHFQGVPEWRANCWILPRASYPATE
jgi:hypothetical protein